MKIEWTISYRFIKYFIFICLKGFQNPTSEEDHIPFVEGSPIISKYGPISRSVNKNVQQNTQSVKVVADEDVRVKSSC